MRDLEHLDRFRVYPHLVSSSTLLLNDPSSGAIIGGGPNILRPSRRFALQAASSLPDR
ncbi:uncharacterized protein VTP21DRAFT_6114 [Calcarisporiella thermophila]|uniref:uncharacterized protein n=1 Tax=Calcarisporiella thermophila TaxID=911321 RepID=UPI0037430AEC